MNGGGSPNVPAAPGNPITIPTGPVSGVLPVTLTPAGEPDWVKDLCTARLRRLGENILKQYPPELWVTAAKNVLKFIGAGRVRGALRTVDHGRAELAGSSDAGHCRVARGLGRQRYAGVE